MLNIFKVIFWDVLTYEKQGKHLEYLTPCSQGFFTFLVFWNFLFVYIFFPNESLFRRNMSVYVFNVIIELNLRIQAIWTFLCLPVC